jgi:hypothetical protein
MEFRYRLERYDKAIVHHQLSAALRAGPWRLKLPRWLAPTVHGSETAVDAPNRMRVAVTVTLPMVGILVAYEGVVEMLERAE